MKPITHLDNWLHYWDAMDGIWSRQNRIEPLVVWKPFLKFVCLFSEVPLSSCISPSHTFAQILTSLNWIMFNAMPQKLWTHKCIEYTILKTLRAINDNMYYGEIMVSFSSMLSTISKLENFIVWRTSLSPHGFKFSSQVSLSH